MLKFLNEWWIDAHRADLGTTLAVVADGHAGVPIAATAEALEVVSTDALDQNSNAAGWAQQVRLTFVDTTSYNLVQETVALNGTTAIALVSTVSGVLVRAECVVFGTGGWTAKGTISIRVAGAGAVRGQIRAGRNTAAVGQFVVPAGYNAQPVGIDWDCDASQWVEVVVRAEYDPWSGLRTPNQLYHLPGMQSKSKSGSHPPRLPSLLLPEKTLVQFAGVAGGANTQLAGRLGLRLTPNNV